jgi:hypothetical protein
MFRDSHPSSASLLNNPYAGNNGGKHLGFLNGKLF